jgi:cytochrome oxidase Cu insertion factor (SCO1/SenC/PrrC family)
VPRWAKVLASVMVLVFVASMAFAILQPIQVLPRIRLAPGYALVDQAGAAVTSEDGRGAITLYTFVPADCGDRCDTVHATMAEVRERVEREIDLAGAELRLVTIVLDPAIDPAAVARAREVAGADWTWVSGSDTQIENVVGLGFRRSTSLDEFTPSYALVDGWGMIRGEYRYQTLADDTDKLVRHIDVLGGELRNDSGLVSFVYEAAHAFQCYP